jgi:uncharacterized membrane protein YbaN (DUF454 family)
MQHVAQWGTRTWWGWSKFNKIQAPLLHLRWPGNVKTSLVLIVIPVLPARSWAKCTSACCRRDCQVLITMLLRDLWVQQCTNHYTTERNARRLDSMSRVNCVFQNLHVRAFAYTWNKSFTIEFSSIIFSAIDRRRCYQHPVHSVIISVCEIWLVSGKGCYQRHPTSSTVLRDSCCCGNTNAVELLLIG